MFRCSYAAALLSVVNLTLTVLLLVGDREHLPLRNAVRSYAGPRRSLESFLPGQLRSGRRLLQSPPSDIAPGTVTTYELPWSADLTRQDPTGEYIALCLVVKNQHLDIREWLLYHRWAGVGKIYVYDHESEPPLLDTILDLVRDGFVEYTYFTGHHQPGTTFMQTAQGHAYHDCLDRHRSKHRWMGFFDSDEFLVVTERDMELAEVLKDYEAYGGLALNWVLFSSSGHVHRPTGPVLTSYWKCYPPAHKINKHVKLFVNPRYTLGLFSDPHEAVYSRQDLFTVNENFERVDGAYTYRASQLRLALHHYMTKSEDEWRQKMERGAGDGKKENMHNFKVIKILASANCTMGMDAGRRFLATRNASTLHWTRPPRPIPPYSQPPLALFPRPLGLNTSAPAHIPVTTR